MYGYRDTMNLQETNLSIQNNVIVFLCCVALLIVQIDAQTSDGNCSPSCTVEQYCLYHGSGISTCGECSEICPGYSHEDIGKHLNQPLPTPRFECQEYCSDYLKLFESKSAITATEKTIVKEVLITPEGILGQYFLLDLSVIILAVAPYIKCIFVFGYKCIRRLCARNRSSGNDLENGIDSDHKDKTDVQSGNVTKEGDMYAPSNSVHNGKAPNGQVPNEREHKGHETNGHIPNGHIPNGKVPNSHVTNGHASKGHRCREHTPNEHQLTESVPNRSELNEHIRNESQPYLGTAEELQPLTRTAAPQDYHHNQSARIRGSSFHEAITITQPSDDGKNTSV
ncbi:uncharacterized protein LOC144453844 [Glandiceps talaboti]